MTNGTIRLSALLGAFWCGCHGGGGDGTTAHEVQPSAAVAVATVDEGIVEETLDAYGRVEFAADRQRTLSFVRPGLVTTVAVVDGQLVRRADELLRVGAVPHGSPEVRQATIAAEFADRELARVSRLVAEKLATNQDVQNAEKQAASARAALQSLGGGGSETPIRAAMDGIVAKVLVHRGDVVQVGQPALMLAPRDSMSIRAGFEVEDLPRLSEGLPVRIESAYHGDNDRPAAATLSTLHRIVDPQTQLVESIIRVDDPPPWMAPGLAVRVVVVLRAHANAIRMPRDALVQEKGSTGVFVIDKGRASWRKVEVGIREAERMEVLSGLQGGEEVATTGRTSLSDGIAVRIAGAPQP